MTGHGYLGNIDPAFPGNSLYDQISSDLNFQKIYFLITWASQYHYQQIPRNPAVKFFRDRNSQRISSHINAHTGNAPKHDFHVNALLMKLPNTSTRGLKPM